MDSSKALEEALRGLIREECRKQGFKRIPARVMANMLKAHKKKGDKAFADVSTFFAEHKKHQQALADKRVKREAKYVADSIDIRRITAQQLPHQYPQSDDGDAHLSLRTLEGERRLLGGADIAATIVDKIKHKSDLVDLLKLGRRLWLIGEIVTNSNGRKVVPVIYWHKECECTAKLKFVETGPGAQYGPPSGYHEAVAERRDTSHARWKWEYVPFAA